ncbi:MAG: hypothetical protein MUC91_11820, partial [Verrucomicrobia bacterium]|nr:hypothetical protein [Verrucomicrobiota bacterium]
FIAFRAPYQNDRPQAWLMNISHGHACPGMRRPSARKQAAQVRTGIGRLEGANTLWVLLVHDSFLSDWL